MSQLNSVWVFSDILNVMLNCLAALSNGANRCMHCTKYRPGAGSYALWSKMYFVLEQNDALQRTENYAESIAVC